MAVARDFSPRLLACRHALAGAEFELRLLRLAWALKRFNPSQPRVPAGQPGGGQWTSEGGVGLGEDATVTPAGSREEERRTLAVDLLEEEARGGHAIREHVGKSDAELVGRIEREYVRVAPLGIPIWEGGLLRAGSFPSLNEAKEWVNKTLDVNRAIVDEVASGRRERAFLTHRFGFVTGREAFVADQRRRTIITRRTYGVGVSIYHDKRSPRGFSVTTAYPRNDDQ